MHRLADLVRRGLKISDSQNSTFVSIEARGPSVPVFDVLFDFPTRGGESVQVSRVLCTNPEQFEEGLVFDEVVIDEPSALDGKAYEEGNGVIGIDQRGLLSIHVRYAVKVSRAQNRSGLSLTRRDCDVVFARESVCRRRQRECVDDGKERESRRWQRERVEDGKEIKQKFAKMGRKCDGGRGHLYINYFAKLLSQEQLLWY